MDNNLLDLQNSLDPTKAEFNNWFIIHSRFPQAFLGQRFNNLQRAALSSEVILTSLVQ